MKEQHFLKELTSYKRIFIYGAGMVGELVFKRLAANNLSDYIKGFVVTNRNSGNPYYLEQPVYEVDELAEDEEGTVFIIATMPDLHSEIRSILLEHSFFNILEIDKMLYEDLAEEYIKDFLNNEEKYEGVIDVIFMSSDNNSSSGAFLSMIDLNCELNIRNINTMVILPEYGNGEKLLIERGIKYTYIPSEHWAIPKDTIFDESKKRKIEANDIAIENLCALVRKNHAKIIHNNSIYTYVGAVAAKREGIKCVWHIRENIEDQNNQFIDKDKALKFINEADKIVFISQYISKRMVQLDEKKGVVIYDLIDVDEFHMEKNLCTSNQGIRITLPGALTEFKRQEDLIRAARYLKDKGYSDFTIRLVGKGPQEYVQKLRDLVEELALQEHVRFMGRCNDMRAIYSDTDIVVVCSGIEALGRVTLEGQLSGNLVIGADAGATEELIEDRETGMLYHYKNPESLAQCIVESMEHTEEARTMARRGQEYAYGAYAKEKSVMEVIKMYEKLR